MHSIIVCTQLIYLDYSLSYLYEALSHCDMHKCNHQGG